MATTAETTTMTNGFYGHHKEPSLTTPDVHKQYGDTNGIMKDKSGANGIVTQKELIKTEYLDGPDQVLPATEYTSSEADGWVRIRMGTTGIAAEQPVSVPGILRRTYTRYPDHPALAFKATDGKWQKITYREYYNRVRTCAKGFIKLGLKRHHSVAILGFNSPEWFISDLGAIHAGGFATGVYTTNSSEACYHCLHSSRANICVVDDSKQLEKILSVRSRLPELKAIVQWEGPITGSHENVYSWEKLMQLGSEEPDSTLDNILKTMGVNECCTLVYTSGTVGNPKAVMLTHDNLTWDAQAICTRADLNAMQEIIVSFLPLSHVAAQVVDIYTTLTIAATVYFADRNALKGSLVDVLNEVKPTKFLAVPRVWEKIHEKMTAIGAANGAVKKAIASWAKDKGLQYNMQKMNGVDSETLGFRLARWLVLKRIRSALGFENCTIMVSAAAPLAPEVKRYFMSIDMPIVEAYGMSEAAGAHTVGVIGINNIDAVGMVLDGVETKFADSVSASGPGEICMRGRHVFMGYLLDPEKTADTIDEDGWLHSGDIGKLDSRNLLYVTGRIKEIIITAGGENVAPIIIEQAVKAELPFVSQAVLIGDRRKFLSMLITLRSNMDLESGAPLDSLDKDTERWVTSLGSSSTKVSEIALGKDAKVTQAIQEGINRANKQAISNAQRIQKFAILPADFSIPTGELGPTLKLKRNVVQNKYEEIIENFYKET